MPARQIEVIFPVWAVFLVSECVYSLELEQLSTTYELLAEKRGHVV